jgi:hypothetical protein
MVQGDPAEFSVLCEFKVGLESQRAGVPLATAPYVAYRHLDVVVAHQGGLSPFVLHHRPARGQRADMLGEECLMVWVGHVPAGCVEVAELKDRHGAPVAGEAITSGGTVAGP